MSRQHSDPRASLLVERDQAVVAIPLDLAGREVVRYAVDVDTSSTTLPDSVREALGLAGAWEDLDWDETVEALDRIRHASRPTPPIAAIDL